ncbi:MAG: D-amino acid dehydrogenase [Proteobacteria bacterium]|nr:D-amino acid dehydrogenase [Pseudomonadota bacterium]
MQITILGAGILGVCTAWYLAEQGHAVTVIDRQPAAALETSFANGAQISVSFCEPWANAGVPLKVAGWLLADDSPLLFRPRLDPAQWRWGLEFLTQCTSAAFAHNVRQLVALGAYSHTALKALVAETGIEYNRLERGILHFFSSSQGLAAGAKAAELMRSFGVDRRLLSRDEVLAVEPALASYAAHIHGGTYTASDESGDAHVFTQALARLAQARGVQFIWNTQVTGLEAQGGRVNAVLLAEADGQPKRLTTDQVVVALGSYSAPLLAPLGLRLAIYPTKGYSVTLRLLRPEAASTASLMDDARKTAISRLGDDIRIAGTAEMAGYDTRLDTPTARVRGQQLVDRYEQLFPGVADLSQPRFWAGLRPSTPNNLPYIGRAKGFANLWLNTGHGTLGWTHGAGSGKALAELMAGRVPELGFALMR